MDICVCITASLCCTPEPNKTLQINYIPIKIIFKRSSGIFKAVSHRGSFGVTLCPPWWKDTDEDPGPPTPCKSAEHSLYLFYSVVLRQKIMSEQKNLETDICCFGTSIHFLSLITVSWFCFGKMPASHPPCPQEKQPPLLQRGTYLKPHTRSGNKGWWQDVCVRPHKRE